MASESISSSSSNYSSAGDTLPQKPGGVSDSNGFASPLLVGDEEALIDKSLPRELLLRVFSFLDVVSLCRAAQVSRGWNELALDGSNWQFVDLFSFQRDISSALIHRLSLRTGGFLHALKLRGCRSLTDDALAQLARSCPNLQKLDLNDCIRLTDDTCVAIATHCTTLTHLNLSGLGITDASLEALSTSAVLTTNLKHLDLSFCTRLTASGLIKLLMTGAHSVQSPNGYKSSHRGSTSSAGTMMEVAVRPLYKLNFFAAKMDVDLATDSSISMLAEYAAASLKTLLLNKCLNLTDVALAAIGTYCPNLTTLALSSCQQLTDASIHSLAAGTPLLTTLEIASCPQLTDSGIGALARGCRLLSRIDLEEVTLITDNTVAALANHCPHLTTMTLSHCELVTDEGLRSLVQAQMSTSYLKVLELDNCPLITDEGLSHLSGLTSLQRLEIYDCQLLTRPGIRLIRTTLPSLKVHAYFAPVTPPLVPGPDGAPPDPLGPNNPGRTICRCCVIL